MYTLNCRLNFLFLFLIINGCAPKYKQYISQYNNNNGLKAPDYNDLYYWAAHPWKKDPADSVPNPLRANHSVDSTADVFFIYPTSFTDPNDTGWNAGINDAFINAKTDYSSILYQASAFNEFRLFSPRYRQAHIRAYFTDDSAKAKAAFDLAYEDIKTAFQYYLDHYNQGRPIIIASHSQGSTHAQKLLKEFFDGRPLQKKLVIAYVVGMYMPENALNSLKKCTDSLQTGCVCGWRTFRKNYEPEFVLKEKGTSVVINPLTWNDSAGFVNRTFNGGSILLKFNKIKKELVGAEVHDGILWIDRMHLPLGFLIRRKNFHIGDINLFYMNIREDVKRRVGYFWKQ